MKEIIRKTIVILVLIIMALNSSLLLVISKSVEAIEETIDETKINPLYEINMEKYVNYSTEISTGTLVQFNLTTGIEYEKEYRPLNSTETILNLPKIEDELPQSIQVIGKSTKATNGSDKAKDFQYEYDKEIGILKIVTENKKDENGEIYTQEINGARDEYTIICYYSANCYNNKNIKRTLELSGYTQSSIADDSEIIKKLEIQEEYVVTKNISGLISTNLVTTNIYNGYIKSNNENGTSYRTPYVENIEMNISIKQLSDEIYMHTDNSFINSKDKSINTDEIIFKTTKMRKNDVLSILGEDGFLQILDENGEILGELNKDTEVGENNVYEVTYNKELSKIIIKTSKAINVGTILLQNTKEIKESMTDIDNNRIQEKNTITCINNIENHDEIDTEENTKIEQKEIYNYADNAIIDIKNSATKVDISLDKNQWTNNIQNEVTFNAVLVSDDSRYSLFKNPIIEIDLPQEVEKVILKDYSLLYDNNLSIKNVNVVEKSDNKAIRIEIEGTQKEYFYNSITKGVNVIISASIIVKKDIETINTNVNVNYLNNGNEKGSKNIELLIKSEYEKKYKNVNMSDTANTLTSELPSGLSTSITAMVGRDILNENDVVYAGEVITFKVKLSNNSSSAMNNVKATCRIADGTIYVVRNTLLSDVPEEDGEGYVTNNLYEEFPSMNEIEIKKDSLQPGETYEEEYSVLVKKVEEEISITNIFNFYVDDIQLDTKQINVTAKSSNLSIGIYPAEKEFFSGKNTYAYYINVNNLTENSINNAIVEVKLDKELEINFISAAEISDSYDSDTGILKINMDSIDANSTELIKISATAKNFEDNNYDYNVKVSAVVYMNEEQKYRSNVEGKQFKTAYFSIIQNSDTEGQNLKAGDEIEYKLIVKNEGEIESYINIVDELPDELLPISAEYEIFKLNDEGIYEKQIQEDDISSKKTIDGIVQPDFSIETYIPAGEIINIKIKAKVNSILKATEIENVATISGSEIFSRISNAIKNKVLAFDYVEPLPDDDPGTDDPGTDDPGTDDPGTDDPGTDDPGTDDPGTDDPGTDDPETDDPGTDDPETDDPGTNNPETSDPSDDKNDKYKYNISGVVWVDTNKDGKRDYDEKLLQGIVVKLFNTKNNKIDVDENGNARKVTTDENGSYIFNNVKAGNYIVLFEYDTEKYYITSYQKSSVSKDLNSDVIAKEINLDEKVYTAGVTDNIDLYKDYQNIDMGLIMNDQFDLKLDKYVSKVSVEYSGQSTTYNYSDSKLAKVEIHAKQIKEAIVKIYYKIVITNEGNVDGYVKELIDHLPNGLVFNQSDNDGWKKNSKGDLVNTSLVENKIKAGDTCEVTLILTAQNVTNTFSNVAEIGSYYNVNSLQDIDSDNTSKADIIISIKTGIIENTFKIIGLVIVLGVILIVIYLLRNKKFRKVFLILLIFVNALGMLNINSEADSAAIRYSNLRWHLKQVGGNWIWEEVSGASIANYWCVSPGQHLCRKEHIYISEGDLEYIWSKDQSVFSEVETNFWNLPEFRDYYCGTINERDATTGEYTSATLNVTQSDYSGINYRLYDENNIIVGPFTASWNVGNLTSQDIEIAGGGSRTFCDYNGNPISTIQNGQPFYVLVSSEIDSITIKANIDFEKIATKQGIQKQKFRIDTTVDRRLYCTQTTAQTLYRIDKVTQPIRISDSKEVSWTLTIPKGKINLYKKDSYTKENITGATIKIQGIDSTNSSYERTITMTSSPYTINNLFPGHYKITEINAPSGYVKEYQASTEVNNIELNFGSNIDITLENQRYTNLRITKDILAPDGRNKKIKDVTFYIYVLDSSGNKMYIGNSCNVGSTSNKANLDLTTNISNAKVFTTNDSGQIILYNIPMDKYFIQEIALPDFYAPWYDISGVENVLLNTYYNQYYDIAIHNKMRVGKLKITKKDFDDSSLLDGAVFNITNNLDPNDLRYVNENKTITGGEITIDNLPIGDYSITEVTAPEGYNLSLQSKTYNVTIQKNSVITLDCTNRKYGNLILQKVDEDTNESKLESVIFENVGFKIYYTTATDSTRKYIKNFVGKTDLPSTFDTTTNIDGAQIFYTNKDGKIELPNIPQKYIYHILEVSLPDEMSMYYNLRPEEYQTIVENNVYTEFTLRKVNNKQKRVDLQGYVWEDIATSKTTIRNNLYDAGSVDKRISGLTVYLKKNGTIIAQRKTDSNGEYFFPARGNYNANGSGSIYTIEIDSLSQYIVEFEYNGLKYENVVVNKSVNNGSKASETNVSRTNFNNNFYNIEKGKTSTGIGLTYTRENYKSKLVDNTAYTAESLSPSVSDFTKAKMLADTGTADYDISWSAGIKTVRNINLGIYERPQPDLAISTDIDNVELTINGYEDTYYYNKRSSYMNNLLPDDSNYNTNCSFSVEFRNNSGYRATTYVRQVYDSYVAYTQSSDSGENGLKVFVTYKMVVKNESSKYEQVSLINYTDKRYVKDSTKTSICRTSDAEFNVNWTKTAEESYATIYQTDIIDRYIAPGESMTLYLTYELEKDGILYLLSNSETTPIINVTEIKSYATYDRSSSGTYNRYGGIDRDSAPDNITYGTITTYEDDTDATPDFKLVRATSKTIKGKVFEDNPVGITKDELNPYKERLGNGKYDSGENVIQDVLATLKDADGNIAKAYKTNGRGGIDVVDAIAITDSSGIFNLDGLVPGTYYIEYTYGKYSYNDRDIQSKMNIDGNMIDINTQSYKSTIVTNDNIKSVLDSDITSLRNNFNSLSYDNRKDAQWYWYEKSDLSIYSSALDDYTKRQEINTALQNINYALENNYLSGTLDANLYSMNAKSAIMDLAIEDYRNQVTTITEADKPKVITYEVNFGIAERPRLSLDLSKEISSVRIALANGQILVEGDPRVETINYTTYLMGGSLKIEVDTEIIEGATLDIAYEIAVKNNSELDYNTEKYYKYGDKSGASPVSIIVSSLVDYIDEKLSVTYGIDESSPTTSEYIYYNTDPNAMNRWKLDPITGTNEIAGIGIDPNVYNSIKGRDNIAEVDIDKELKPNPDEVITFNLSAKKLLTDLSSNDQSFDNYVEILELSNSIGRFYGEMKNNVWKLDTPGNFNITKVSETIEADNNYYGRKDRYNAQLSIIPPTGIKSIIIYTSIGLVCLITIAGGLIFIKKTINSKKM